MAGVYIHIPYCHAKCYYCDFYSTPNVMTQADYAKALVAEARLRRSELREDVRTVYIGGGTPSSLGAGAIEQLITGIKTVIPFDNVVEFTVEVNPEDVNDNLLSTLKGAGVNRISMGVQSLVDAELKAVGRRHSSADAVNAARLVASHFDNFSLDLIYGLPGQTLESLNYTLDEMLKLGATHLSAYLLSFEPGTRLYAQLMSGKVQEVSDETAQAMYELVDSRLEAAGYGHYEISNFALEGMESRHNSSYWDSTPYLGLGASAHSFDGDLRRFNPSDVKKYTNSLLSGKTCCEIDEETIENKFNDYLITCLRTARGLDLKALEHGQFNRFLPMLSIPLQKLSGEGLVAINDGIAVIPKKHWLTSDAIMRELIV